MDNAERKFRPGERDPGTIRSGTVVKMEMQRK